MTMNVIRFFSHKSNEIHDVILLNQKGFEHYSKLHPKDREIFYLLDYVMPMKPFVYHFDKILEVHGRR